jgi:hypothetical protein
MQIFIVFIILVNAVLYIPHTDLPVQTRHFEVSIDVKGYVCGND